MAQTLIITLIAVGLAVLLLGVRVFFTKNWGFPDTHVDGNKALTDRGLTCHRQQAEEALHHKNLADRLAMNDEKA